MKPAPINIPELLTAAVKRGLQRWHLAAMLAVLYGAVSSILNEPSFAILEALTAATNATADRGANGQPMDFSPELEILKAGLPTLVAVYLAGTALSALLLVPWARAIAPGGLTPGQGNTSAHATRFARSFGHFITATLLTGLAFVGGGTIVITLGSLIGFLAMPLVFAGGLGLIWVSIILNAVANYAVFFEAQDKPIGFLDTWRKFKPAVIPLSACLAVFFMASIIASFIVSGLFGTAGSSLQLVTMALNGALGFMVSALHIAALAHFNEQR